MNLQNHNSHPDNDNILNSNDETHNFIIPKQSLLKKCTLTLKILDDIIYQMYLGFIGNFDTTINDMEVSKIIKNILHSRQILFFYVLFRNFWMIYSNIRLKIFLIIDGEERSNYEMCLFYVKYLFYIGCLISFCISLLFILILKFKNFSQMEIKRNNELEQYILSKNKDLKKNLCNECNVVRCMRSFHCNYCNKCVTKFELHSNWFNTCIGSQNILIYAFILLFLNIFFLSCILNYSLQIFFIDKQSHLYDFRFKIFYLHFWFIFTIYLELKLFAFAFRIIRRGLFTNLTENERTNRNRLPYLWKNASKEFFNPFDRGCWNNFKDAWSSWRNKKVDISERINIELIKNENLNVTADIVTVNKTNCSGKNLSTVISTDDDFVLLNNDCIDQKKQDISLSEGNLVLMNKMQFDYFITSNDEIYYRTYDPVIITNSINWNRIRLYTIFDLFNSPFRKILQKN